VLYCLQDTLGVYNCDSCVLVWFARHSNDDVDLFEVLATER